MNWSRRRGQPAELWRRPEDDQPPRSVPLLARPFEGGVTGWIVICAGVIAELAGGAAVANQMSTTVAVLVLIVPVVVVFGFAVVQWWQVRTSGAEPANWWHLGGAAVAVLIWALWPTIPGPLSESTNNRAFCNALPTTEASDCLRRTAQAFDNHNIAYWSTAALILIAALLVRRSRMAPWAAIPAALAGCQLATYFLNQIVLSYHLV